MGIVSFDFYIGATDLDARQVSVQFGNQRMPKLQCFIKDFSQYKRICE